MANLNNDTESASEISLLACLQGDEERRERRREEEEKEKVKRNEFPLIYHLFCHSFLFLSSVFLVLFGIISCSSPTS